MRLAETAFRAKVALGGRASSAALRAFLAADALDAPSIQALGAARSIAHARFAFAHSPFYRELYAAHGIRASDLTDPAAFASLPIVDKTMLREHGQRIRTDEWSRATAATSRTGGSTGVPLHVERDVRFPARALEWRLFHWWGLAPWANRAIITRHMHSGVARVRHRASWWPSAHVQLDAFRIDDDAVRAFAAAWRRARPHIVVGYAGGVLELVRRLARLGVHVPPPRAVAVTAAPLTPGVRAEIERLGAPVHDHYRSAEVPWIAGECREHNGLHVFADVRHIEILDEADAAVPIGEDGAVVVSDYTNRVFPIVRYRIGDVSRLLPGTCACGRALPRLGQIAGRASDAVRLPDGTTIAGALGHLFDDAPHAVRQFEIVQAVDGAVTLRCIPGTLTRDETEAGIAHAALLLRRAVRGLVPVAVERVDDLPHTGGKMRFIRSAVRP